MEFKKYLIEKEIITEEEEKDEMSDQDMMEKMIKENWSKSPEKVAEACKYMQEMAGTDDKKSDKFLKEMDDFTSSLKESYVLGTTKPRK